MSMSKKQVLISRTEISDLNDDLLKAILFRLPLKSLHISKCVSKKWNDVSSKAPLRKPIGTPAGLFYCDLDGQGWGYTSSIAGEEYEDDPMANFDPSLSFLPCHPQQLLISACNGLLLCLENGDHWLNFLVCNPVTKTWASVPMPESVGGAITHFAALDYDPNVSPHFRIIRFMHRCEGGLVNSEVLHINHFFGEQLIRDPWHFNPPKEMDIEVFSSETGRWVKSTILHGARVSCSWLQSLTLNGVLYKLANPRYLLRYDLKENGVPLAEIQLPDDAGCATYGCLGLSEGSLHFAHCDVFALKIWQLRNSNGGGVWHLKHAIPYDNLRELAVLDLGSEWGKISHRPAGFLSDYEIAFLEGNGVVAYDYKLFRIRRLSSLKPYSVTTGQFKNFTFSPCLHDPARVLKPSSGTIKLSNDDESEVLTTLLLFSD
ncbi:putative F-box/kelch-repeat protein At4g22430 [Aristolochia californica]|uniref:putative F-box/kelch-repeat protein At4g22430 n=1 Tax=Aristolochia californica TaxID=171875 RepID=UPI0035DE11C2